MREPEAARRYLQASRDAGYTGLPDEHRQAQEELMRRLERQHPDVRQRALAGTDQDFDRRLEPGLREHQAHLRRQAGLDEGQLHKLRQELRGRTPAVAKPRGRRRAAVRAGVAGGRGYARARRAVASSSGVQSTGAITLQAAGVAIGLALLYLALSPNGSQAFSTLLNGVSGFLRLLVEPVDPLNPPKRATTTATGAGPIGSQPGPPSLAGGAFAASPIQRRKLGPAFGPAPGLGTPITPIGVAP